MSVKSLEKIRFRPLASHIPMRAVNKPAGPSLCLPDHKQRRRRGCGTFQILKQKSTSSHVDGSMGGGKGVCVWGGVETLQGQCPLPARWPHKPGKRNLFEEGFVFPASVLLTADVHQETVEMFWLYGWEAFILSIFIYSLWQKHAIKTKHPSSFGKCYDIKHLIHSHAPYVLIWDLLAICLERGWDTHALCYDTATLAT